MEEQVGPGGAQPWDPGCYAAARDEQTPPPRGGAPPPQCSPPPGTGTQARPPRGGEESGVLQLHSRVEVVMADMARVVAGQWSPGAQWGGQPHDIPRDGWAQEARGAQLQEPHGGPHDVQLHGHEFHTGHCIVMYRNFVIRSFQSPR